MDSKGERQSYRHMAVILVEMGVQNEHILTEPKTLLGVPDLVQTMWPHDHRPSNFLATFEMKTGEVLREERARIQIEADKAKYTGFQNSRFHSLSDCERFVRNSLRPGVPHFEASWAELLGSDRLIEATFGPFAKLTRSEELLDFQRNPPRPHRDISLSPDLFIQAGIDAYSSLAQTKEDVRDVALLQFALLLQVRFGQDTGLHHTDLQSLCKSIDLYNDSRLLLTKIAECYAGYFPGSINPDAIRGLTHVSDLAILEALWVFAQWDFKTAPPEVISCMFERLPLDHRTSSGLFCTQQAMSDLAAKILGRDPQESFVDPTAGLGTTLISELDRALQRVLASGYLKTPAVKARDVVQLLGADKLHANDLDPIATAISDLLILMRIETTLIPHTRLARQIGLGVVGTIKRTSLDVQEELTPLQKLAEFSATGVYPDDPPFMNGSTYHFDPPSVRHRLKTPEQKRRSIYLEKAELTGNYNLSLDIALRCVSRWMGPESRAMLHMIPSTQTTTSGAGFRQALENLVLILDGEPSQNIVQTSTNPTNTRIKSVYGIERGDKQVLRRRALELFKDCLPARPLRKGEIIVITPSPEAYDPLTNAIIPSKCQVTFVLLNRIRERLNLRASSGYEGATTPLRSLPSLDALALNVTTGIEFGGVGERALTKPEGRFGLVSSKENSPFLLRRPTAFLDECPAVVKYWPAVAQRVMDGESTAGVYLLREKARFPFAHPLPAKTLPAKSSFLVELPDLGPLGIDKHLDLYLLLEVVLSYVAVYCRNTAQERMRATYGVTEIRKFPVPSKVSAEFVDAGLAYRQAGCALYRHARLLNALTGPTLHELMRSGHDIVAHNRYFRCTSNSSLDVILGALAGEKEQRKLGWQSRVPVTEEWADYAQQFSTPLTTLREQFEIGRQHFNSVGERMLGFSEEQAAFIRAQWVTDNFHRALATYLPGGAYYKTK